MGSNLTTKRALSTVATVLGPGPTDGTAPGRLQLVVVEGHDMGRAIALSDKEIVAGTDPSCELELSDDRISRRHAAFWIADGGVVVRDLGSRNGTLYAGSAIRQAAVPLGGTLKLGRTFVRIQPCAEPLEVEPSQARQFGEMFAESLAMREVFAVLELAAQSDVTVLLQGETGTGKELAARALHEQSNRRRKPFVALDCGALPGSLLESELFGHRRGAFTGATEDRKGAFVRADGGTLFLDELDSIPLSAQARLLRVVEERNVRPVGADQQREVDVRLVAASRRNLPARVAEGKFRPDLYFRLAVLQVELPPLRERREDIAPVVSRLLTLRGFEQPQVAGDNLDRLLAYDWPGNMRELRNVIDRAVALAPTARQFEQLRVAVLPSSTECADALAVRTDINFAAAKQRLVQAFERRYLADVLARCSGNISATAREAGIDRKHLRTLLKRHGLLADAPDE